MRIVVRNRIPNDKRFKGSYVPRERALEVKNPLLIWVGAADRSSDEWFTFGDLVSLNGLLGELSPAMQKQQIVIVV